MIMRNLPQLPRPICLRLLSNASLVFKATNQEASVHETFIAILRALPRNSAFWDVGANVGFFTWHCAICRPDFEIVSFEPDIKNLLCLRRTSRSWNLPLHTVVPCAVADSTGRAPFFPDDLAGATGTLEEAEGAFNARHYGSHARQIEVETISLDEFLASRHSPPSIIKIDVEGAELRVVKGGCRIIDEHRPILLFETFAHRDELVNFLGGFGYLFYDSDRREDLVDETVNFLAVVPERWPLAMTALIELGYPIGSHNEYTDR